MIDLAALSWLGWLLLLLAMPLALRSLAYGVALAGRWRIDGRAGLANMLRNRSIAYEWESRAMTLAVVLAACALALGEIFACKIVLALWMISRWWRFAENVKVAAVSSLVFCVLGWLAVQAEGASPW